MKNQPNKATVKDGLPTAKKVLAKHYDVDNRVDEAAIVYAMQSYSDQQNAELRERVSKLETENKDYYLRVKELEFVGQVDSDCIESQSNEIDDLKAWKESAMKELNAIDLQSLGKKLGIGLGQSVSENVHAKVDGLRERVKELESLLAKYREALEDVGIALRNEGFVNSTGEGVEEAARIVREALKQEEE